MKEKDKSFEGTIKRIVDYPDLEDSFTLYFIESTEGIIKQAKDYGKHNAYRIGDVVSISYYYGEAADFEVTKGNWNKEKTKSE